MFSGKTAPPGAFLPSAERHGLIDRIDRWVVTRVPAWLAGQNPGPQIDMAVCINLSGASAADTNFQRFLINSIESAAVHPAHLCFEITETAAVQSLRSTADFLSQLRSLGCKIALDDFGIGFASLEYIKQLPLDFIKIDGAFVRDRVNNPLDRALIRCVADIATLLKIQTVAEFVEDKETLAVLRSPAIDFAQGYLFAKPEPLTSLSEIAIAPLLSYESAPVV